MSTSIIQKNKIGKYSYGEPKIFFDNPETKYIIGNFCSIADNVKFYLGGNHRTDWITTYPFGHINQNIFNQFNGLGHPSSKGDIIIGNDVWIGANVNIMSGVIIPDGVVIANNSHVVKNVDKAYCIIGGNPAKFIKLRFSEEQIKKLLEIQWWNWDDQKINDNSTMLCSNNIDDFISHNQIN